MDLIISFLIPRKCTFLLEFIIIIIGNSDIILSHKLGNNYGVGLMLLK